MSPISRARRRAFWQGYASGFCSLLLFLAVLAMINGGSLR